MAVLLYTYFYNISLNVLRLTFFNIYNLPFYALKISLKFRSKLGQKPITFPIFWAPAPTELQFSIFFSLICSKPRDRQNLVRDFLLSKYFLNNLHLTVFSNHENCNMKFLLNTFSDQIAICEISFEIFDVKQIDARAKK